MAEIEQSMLTDQCLSTCIPAVRGRCAAKRPSSPDDRRGAMKRKRRSTDDSNQSRTNQVAGLYPKIDIGSTVPIDFLCKSGQNLYGGLNLSHNGP